MSRLSEMVFIRNQQTQRWMDVTGEDVACWSDKRQYIESSAQHGFWATLGQLLLAGFCCLLLIGCGATELPSPEVSARAAELSTLLTSSKTVELKTAALATTLAAQKLTGEQTLETAQAIMAKLNTMEASLVVPKAEPGKEVIKSAPESPAKANTQQAPLKVATPGTSSETLVELATRLYSQGVSVHMKTEEQLRAIDAQMNGGAPVTGAIFPNNGASAVTSKRNDLRLIPRGRTVFQWKKNTSGQTCGPNGCY
jgi:hypothetical protein